MIDHDGLFKTLLTTFFVELIELFFPKLHSYLDASSVEFLDKELFTEIVENRRREADIVVKARFRGGDSFFLINLENQGTIQNYAEFCQRVFFYFALLHQKFKLPVYSIVVFYGASPKKPIPGNYRIDFPDGVLLDFHFRVVQLNRLRWRNFINQANPLAAALMAKMGYKKEERPYVKLECLRLLTTFKLESAKMRLLSGFIDTYLKLDEKEEEIFDKEIAKIEPRRRKKVMELTTSWKEEGIKEGIAIGEKRGMKIGETRGRQQEALNLALRLLRRRLGSVAPILRKRIERLTIAQLEELSESSIDFSDKTDLVTWLEKHSI